MSHDHEPVTAFAAGPPTMSAVAALSGLGPAELGALVTALEEEEMRDHLEALGASDRIPAAARKAARKAAYRLKSRGVATVTEAPRSGGVDLRATVELDGRVLALAPGLGGHYLVILGELDDAQAMVIEITGSGVHVGRVGNAGRADLRSRARAERDLILGHAELGVQLAARVALEIRALGGEFPSGWSEVVWWCERAQALGADPTRADAGLAFKDEPLPGGDAAAIRALLGRPTSGACLPPRAALEELEVRAEAAANNEAELDRAETDELLVGVADGVCDEFYAASAVREAAVRSLDASADVLFAAGLVDDARHFFATARELGAGALMPRELPLLREAFLGVFDLDRFWAMRQEIVAGRSASAQAERPQDTE